MALTKVSRGLLTTSIVDNGNATAITIDSSENVGIGSSSPATQLFVKSAANAANVFAIESADAAQRLQFGVNTSNGGSYIFEQKAQALRFGTSDTERMQIDSSGNLLVGKTVGSSPGTIGLEVQQDGEVYSTIATGFNTYHVYANSGYRFYVNPNGGLYNYSANNVNLSDEREKKNIEALESQWGSLQQWSLKKFHYNADADSDTKKLGVIAQEVEVHNPEVISEFSVDEDTTRMAVKEQQMMWMAIKALQEAMERIETLEAKVQTLENN